MIPWVQVYSNLPHHQKIARLADELGLSSTSVGIDTAAVGIVVSLWAWAVQNAYTGDLSDVSDRVIAEACRWKKRPEALVNALISSGWIDEDRHIHDWEEHSILLIDAEDNRKRNDRERAKRYRDRKRDEAAAAHENSPAASRDNHVTDNVTHSVTVQENHGPTIPDHIISAPPPSARVRAREDGEQPKPGIDPGLAKVMGFYMDKINPMPASSITAEVMEYLKIMEPDVIIAAIEYAMAENKTGWSYISGTLKGYKQDGIRTMSDLRRSKAQFERDKQKRREDTHADNSRNSKGRRPTAPRPDTDPLKGFHTEQ